MQPTDLIGWMELNLLLGVSHTIVYYMEASASVKCSEIEETTLQRAPGDESAGILRGSWPAPTYYMAVASHKQTVQVEVFYIQRKQLVQLHVFCQMLHDFLTFLSIRYFGQNLLLHDCLHRSRHMHNFTIFTDLDEHVIPENVSFVSFYFDL